MNNIFAQKQSNLNSVQNFIFPLIAASLIASILNPINAQKNPSKFPESNPRQNIYIELGGNGLAFTGVYETRLRKASDGVGMKVGIGGFTNDYEKVITAPVALNWLITKDNKHFFEMGIGATFLHYENKDTWIWPSPQGPYPYNIAGLTVSAKNSVVGNFTMGYRRQPADGGIMWGVAITPHLNGNGFWPLWFGVKFGYSFSRK